jgi:hypothetical protein
MESANFYLISFVVIVVLMFVFIEVRARMDRPAARGRKGKASAIRKVLKKFLN